MSEYESQNAMMTAFLESFDELDEVIDRLERVGLCSEDVEFARGKFEELCVTLWILITKKVELEIWLAAPGKVLE